MIISFAMTESQLLEGSKTVTRRLWASRTIEAYRAGTVHQAWNKLPRSNNSKQIALIKATRNAYLERLGSINQAEVYNEGFPLWTTNEFIDFFIEAAAKQKKVVTPDTLVAVARFQLVEVV